MTTGEHVGDGGVRSVQRALDLLDLFDEQHPRRHLRDLVEGARLPKTTVVRLLATLESRAWVARLGETTWTVGPSLLRWVRLGDRLWQVSPAARAVMRELVGECGETVNVYVRQGRERVSIAQEEGSATVRSVVAVGRPMPLGRGATAKVLLSGAPVSLVAELATLDPQLDAGSLERQVAGVRETGYAVSHGERELGASAVAAPVLAADGRVLAALSVSGPTSRFTAEQVTAYVGAVTAAAKEIGRVGLGGVEALL